jgi:hypothetical protein
MIRYGPGSTWERQGAGQTLQDRPEDRRQVEEAHLGFRSPDRPSAADGRGNRSNSSRLKNRDHDSQAFIQVAVALRLTFEDRPSLAQIEIVNRDLGTLHV